MRFGVGLVFSALLLSGHSAQSQIATLADTPPTLAVISGYPPYADSRLPDGGYLTRVVKAALQASGTQYRLVEMPVNRALFEVAHGGAEAALPLARTDEREKIYRFSDPLSSLTIAAFVPGPAANGWTGIAAMNGKSACLPAGSPTPSALIAGLQEGRLKPLEANDLEACVRMLSAGRVDILISDPHVVWHLAKTIKVERRIALVQDDLGIGAHYLLARRGDERGEALLSAFNRGLSILRTNGSYDDLMRPVRQMDETRR